MKEKQDFRCGVCGEGGSENKQVKRREGQIFIWDDVKCRDRLLSALIRCILDPIYISKGAIKDIIEMEKLEQLWLRKFQASFYKELYRIMGLFLPNDEEE